MSIRKLRLLAPTLLIGLLVLTCSVVKQTSAGASQNDAWTTFAPPDEEISVPIPAPPVVRDFPISKQRDPHDTQERVLAHRAYNGYGNGLVYVIDSFKAEHPEKLSADNLGLVDKQGVFERLFFDGTEGQLFRSTVNQRYAPYSK